MQQQIVTATPEEYLMKFKTPHEVISSQCHHDVELEMAWDNDIRTILQVQFINLNLYISKKEQKLFADDEKIRIEREIILDQLRLIVLQWLATEISSVTPFKGELLVLGSFRMDVYGNDSDIDTCIIAPSCVSRDDHFFGNFYKLLKCNQHVKKIYQITQTQVPLIKFEFKGVYIDMMFASIESPAEQLTSSIPCDDKSLWSLNGIQVADYFYNKYHDDVVFKVALRAIKQWAINNGIYRSVLGYLSGIQLFNTKWAQIKKKFIGVTCAIMVGKIHQLYPHYPISQLLFKFFFIYNQWRWEHIPLILEKEPEQIGKSVISKKRNNRIEFRGNLRQFIDDNFDPNLPNSEYYSECDLSNVQNNIVAIFSCIQNHYRVEKQFQTMGIFFLIVNKILKREVLKPINFFDLYHQYLEIRILSKDEEVFISNK